MLAVDQVTLPSYMTTIGALNLKMDVKTKQKIRQVLIHLYQIWLECKKIQTNNVKAKKILKLVPVYHIKFVFTAPYHPDQNSDQVLLGNT